jgi:hypothetical protein
MADTVFVDGDQSLANRIVAAWLNQMNNNAFYGRKPNYATTTGAANAQILTLGTGSLYAAGSEATGDTFFFTAGFSNSAAATLQVIPPAGLNTARAIQLRGNALSGGEIVAGQTYMVTRLGTTWQLMSPAENTFIRSVLAAVSATGVLDVLAAPLAAESAPALDDYMFIYDLNEGAWNLINPGNLFKLVNLLTNKPIPLAADKFLLYSIADSDVRSSSLDQLPLPRSYLAGCGLANNAGDATNDIDIAVGVCRDSTNITNINCAAMTKRLDANWAAGTNQGFRNSAAAITDTTYNIYAVATAAGVQDYYAHTSLVVATVLTALQAETGGASYIYARMIGSILRESGAIVLFTQTGDDFIRATFVLERSGALNNTTELVTLNVPAGRRIKARISAYYDNAAGGESLFISDPSQTDVVGAVAGPLTMYNAAADGRYSIGYMELYTNTSSQIRIRSDGTMNVNIFGYGWTDRRGRDD